MTARELHTEVAALSADLRAALATAATVGSLSALPTSTVGVLRSTLRLGRATCETLMGEIYAMDSTTDVTGGEAILAALEWQHELTASLVGLQCALRVALDRIGQAQTAERRRLVYARDGDTWAHLAARELGDHRRAIDIAELNGGDITAAPLGQVWVPA